MISETNFSAYTTTVIEYHKLVEALGVDMEEAPATVEAQMAFAGVCRVVADSPELIATYQSVLEAAGGKIHDPYDRAKAFDGARSVETALINALYDHELINGGVLKQEQNKIKDGTWVRRKAEVFMDLFATVIDGTWDKEVESRPGGEASLDLGHLKEEPLEGNTFEVTIASDGVVWVDGAVPNVTPREAVVLRMLIETYQAAPGAFISNSDLRNMPAWKDVSRAVSEENDREAFRLAIRALRNKLVAVGLNEFLETASAGTSKKHRLRVASLTEVNEIPAEPVLQEEDSSTLKFIDSALVTPPDPPPILPPDTSQVKQRTPVFADIRVLEAAHGHRLTLAQISEHFNSYGKAMDFVIEAVRGGYMKRGVLNGEACYSILPDSTDKTS